MIVSKRISDNKMMFSEIKCILCSRKKNSQLALLVKTLLKANLKKKYRITCLLNANYFFKIEQLTFYNVYILNTNKRVNFTYFCLSFFPSNIYLQILQACSTTAVRSVLIIFLKGVRLTNIYGLTLFFSNYSLWN